MSQAGKNGSQTTLRCAIYIRNNVRAEFNSKRTQHDAAQAFIARHNGWICVGMYEDIDHSNDTIDRPGLRKLLADLEADKIDCVVLHTLDRLTRSTANHAQLVATFQRWNVTLVTASPVNFVVQGSEAGDASTGSS